MVTIVNKEKEKVSKSCPEGERWDEALGRCVEITTIPTREPTGGILTKPETARPSGIELPGGRTFLGLSPEEVATIQKQQGLEDMGLVGHDPKRQEELRRLEVEARRKEEFREIEELPERPIEAPPEEVIPEEEKGFVEKYLWTGWPKGEELSKGFEALTLAFGGAAFLKGGGKAVKVGKNLLLPASSKAVATKAAQKTIITKTTTGISEAGILARLWASKVGKAIITLGVTQGFIEAYASALDGANMQMKEELSEGIVSSVRNGAFTPMEGMMMVRGTEDNVNTNERTIKILNIFSLRAIFLAKFEPIKKRIRKIKTEIAEAKQNIRIIAANPIPPSVEQLALAVDEMKGGE